MERYKQHGVLDVVLTLASAIEDEKASKVQVDHLILELLYLLYLRSTPDDVAAATADPTRSAAKVCCVRARACCLERPILNSPGFFWGDWRHGHTGGRVAECVAAA